MRENRQSPTIEVQEKSMTEEMQDIAVEGAAFAKKIFDDVREF